MTTPSDATGEPGTVVRPARPDDEAFVVGLARRFAETRPPWRTEVEITRGTAVELRRAFARLDPGAALLIALDAAGERIGFAYVVVHADFFTKEPHGHLSEIAVTREGSGAGRALMQGVERHVRDSGLRFLTLNVHEGNLRGHAFYRALGFEPNTRQYVKVLESTSPARPAGPTDPPL
jgi:ribosomal protein S18 acetylase RimI-like enzyme